MFSVWNDNGCDWDCALKEILKKSRKKKTSQLEDWKTLSQIEKMYGSTVVAESIVQNKKVGAPFHPVENPHGTWRNHPETEAEEAIQYYVGVSWATEKSQSHENSTIVENEVQVDGRHAVRLNNSMAMPNDAGAILDVPASDGRQASQAVASSRAAEEKAAVEREKSRG